MKKSIDHKFRLTKFTRIFLLVAGLSGAVAAATFTVANAADINDDVCDAGCFLRRAVATADGSETVENQNLSTPQFETSKFIPSNVTIGANFGFSVALDDDTAIIGASGEQNGSGAAQGAAYIFVRNNGEWAQQARLTISNETVTRFGKSVAISGNTVVVGASVENVGANSRGAAYVFVRSGVSWTLEQKLFALNTSDNSFGQSVAIAGNTAVVGAPAQLVSGLVKGAAYVFGRDGTTWTQANQISDTDGRGGDQFGASVAINNGTILVGSPFGDVVGMSTNEGAVCLFTQASGIWTRQARLTASDGRTGDQFGFSVAIETNTIIVGAVGESIGTQGGRAYVFARNGATWTQLQKLAPTSTKAFGSSVGISGDTIVIGASQERVIYNGQGAAYIFIRNGNLWIQQPGRLTASDGYPDDRFGSSVAVDGNKIIVGAPSNNGTGLFDQGSAYFFLKPPGAPDLQAASDTGVSDNDNITKLRNVSFDVVGLTGGATVELIRDGAVINSAVAGGSVATLTDVDAPADGTFHYSSRQIVNGETSSVSEATLITFDNTSPTVAVNHDEFQPDPTTNSFVSFRIDVSEPVTGLDASDISFAGSTANLSAATFGITSQNPLVYSLSVSNIVANNQTVVASIPAGGVADVAGNLSLISIAEDNTITVDNVRPTATINQAANQVDPTANPPVNFTVVFSEPVTGFSNASDVSLSGSTANVFGATINITGSGMTYNVAVSNFNSNGQFVRAAVNGGAAQDSLGNGNFTSTSTDNTVTVDNVRPTVTINQAAVQADPTSTQPVNFTVTFSEAVSSFEAADVSLAGSTANISAANIVVTGGGTTYSVAVGNVLSSGQIRAGVTANAAQDALGNLSNASTSTDNIVTLNVRRNSFDFDGDGRGDISVFRPENGTWYLSQSASGYTGAAFGLSTDKIVPADYDGDGKTDVAVFRNGTWYLQRSQLGFTGMAFGAPDDIPVPGDYDGDGRADVAVFRPSNGTWYLLQSTAGFTAIAFGQTGDKPVAADYDGDGKADIAVFRGGTWYVQRSQLGFVGIAFGESTDKPAVGDYDGDGKTDIAVFRPSNGAWYLLRSQLGFTGINFGFGTDAPVPADYDGDGKTDVAVFRDGTWYLQQSQAGFTGVPFGAATDKPVPGAFIP